MSFSNTLNAGDSPFTIRQNGQSGSCFHDDGMGLSLWALIMKEVILVLSKPLPRRAPQRWALPKREGQLELTDRFGPEFRVLACLLRIPSSFGVSLLKISDALGNNQKPKIVFTLVLRPGLHSYHVVRRAGLYAHPSQCVPYASCKSNSIHETSPRLSPKKLELSSLAPSIFGACIDESTRVGGLSRNGRCRMLSARER